MTRRLCWVCHRYVPQGDICPGCGSHAFFFQSDAPQPEPELPDTGPAIPARRRGMKGYGPL